ncbi:MAG: pectinacetylesterase family protein, partial [Chloroflexota bacterium]|nr:pectinacetylesterase family protein [Chloroflexota bacterium]
MWVRRGDPGRLVFYLQPGGGCWDYGSCRPGSPFFDDSVTGDDDPTDDGGIFELGNPDNPFRDASFVYVPSCTGDVHSGDAVHTYRGSGGESVTIQHKGFVNVRAALQWTYANVAEPRSVFVTGCSAGSAGSALVAPYLIEHYRNVRATQLGDSLAFVFHRPIDLADYGTYSNLPPWIAGLRALGPGPRFTMARYYTAVARHYPDRAFAQFNTAHDRVQARFYVAVGGTPQRFAQDLSASLREVEAAAPNFHSFTAGGDAHCVLPNSRFY